MFARVPFHVLGASPLDPHWGTFITDPLIQKFLVAPVGKGSSESVELCRCL